MDRRHVTGIINCWLDRNMYSKNPIPAPHKEREYRARSFKCLWGPGIDSKEWIPPAYVAWRAGTKTLFLLSA